jgi:hypothetical protein
MNRTEFHKLLGKLSCFPGKKPFKESVFGNQKANHALLRLSVILEVNGIVRKPPIAGKSCGISPTSVIWNTTLAPGIPSDQTGCGRFGNRSRARA